MLQASTVLKVDVVSMEKKNVVSDVFAINRNLSTV